VKELLDLADTLGKKIAESPRYAGLRLAEERLEGDDEAKQLFDDYVEQNNRLAEMEASGSPIEPDDKRKLAEAREKLLGCEMAQELVRCQADFAELMNSVNEKIRDALRDAASGG